MSNKTKFIALCVGILILGLLVAPVLADQSPAVNSPGSIAYPIPTIPPYPPVDPNPLIFLPIVMRQLGGIEHPHLNGGGCVFQKSQRTRFQTQNRRRTWLWLSAAVSFGVGFILVLNNSGAGWFFTIIGIIQVGDSTRAGQGLVASTPSLVTWELIGVTLQPVLLAVVVGAIFLLSEPTSSKPKKLLDKLRDTIRIKHSNRLSTDPRSRITRRHHFDPSGLQRAVKIG